MIYLFCVYLVYKGCEIFQVAFVSTAEEKVRRIGLVLGVLSIIGAFVVGATATYFTERIASTIDQNMQNFPTLPPMR